SRDLYVALLDADGRTMRMVYSVEHGVRLNQAPFVPPDQRVWYRELRAGRTLVCRTAADFAANELAAMPGTDMCSSGVYLPILVGERFIGQVGIESFEREDAFDASAVRLLQTVVASLGTALENARLFDETQRLLKETEARNAELAVINAIQQGISAELKLQSIIDLVGDKLRDVFATGDIGIWWWDAERRQLHSSYVFEHGVRHQHPPYTVQPGEVWERVYLRRETLLVSNRAESIALGMNAIEGTDQSLSALIMPIVGGDRVLGGVVLEDYARENAFGPDAVRLLSTVVAAMGTALENARLFDETQRLFKQSEQRAAELAIVNSVQAALAAKLDVQAIHQLVGDKVRDVFDAQGVLIGLFDHDQGVEVFTYNFEKGQYHDDPPRPLNGLRQHLIQTRQTIFHPRITPELIASFGATAIGNSTMAKSAIFVPMVVANEVKGYVSIQNVDRFEAFTEADMRLLETLTGSLAVAFENARLFDETQRLLKETEQRSSELAVINSIQQGMAAEMNFQGIVDLVGDKLREVFASQDLIIGLLDADGLTARFVYAVEHGVRMAEQTFVPSETWAWYREMRLGRTLVARNAADYAAYDMGVMPGTDAPTSGVYVPVMVGD
ncbi:MAG TPA: GAF domain-containing protein, partial [Burkholderiaceae bacterium]|nr:GAF domain-containing protein [Burkholderiaceae bacterium]